MPIVRRDASSPRRGWPAGAVLPGVAIILSVALIDAVRQSIRLIVVSPIETWIGDFLQNYVYAATIGAAMLIAAIAAIGRAPPRGPRAYVIVGAAVAAAAAVGVAAFIAPEYWPPSPEPPPTATELAMLFVPEWARYSALGLLVVGAWLYVRAEAAQAAAIEQVALDAARMDAQTAEARLQVLEAQIEPHFLFNTLAHVRRLYEIDRDAGARMLRNLKAYLAVALPQMRAQATTLGREVDHAVAYLDIQRIRMGQRLAFAVDVPDALRAHPMPPLMLLTLVENAIKHGLAPSRDGGRIDIRARIDGNLLRVDVADTGIGFTRATGTGTGLANIRARLHALFGDAARLSLAQNAPHGIVATIALPVQAGFAAPTS